MSDDLAQYSFVPWFRRGGAADITAADDLTATATGRAAMPVELSLSYVPLDGGTAGTQPSISRTVELVGPGDVRTLRQEAVLRVYPPADGRDASPGELAFVEFYDEDLPWRYTPARAATGTPGGAGFPRLRPWLALFVLPDGGFTLMPRAGGASVLTVAATTELPPVLESWAWAHAQLAGGVSDPAEAGTRAGSDPDAALSRLLSPCRLQPMTAYTAFIVPAFETGRRSGLGLDPRQAPTQQASWGAGQQDPRFPVYHSWRFATGTDGSFESYVRRLQAQPAGPRFGKRPIDFTAPGYGLDGVPVAPALDLEGALRPPHFQREPYPQVPGTAMVAALEGLVDLGSDLLDPDTEVPEDPIVAPPAYGRWHAGVLRVGDVEDGDEAGWVRELNLDPRNRAVAGLGAQVVRDRQEELMARAWDQVGRLRDANQRLREAELAMTAADAAFSKHLEGLPPDRLLLLTAPAHRGLPVPAAAASAAAPAVAAPATAVPAGAPAQAAPAQAAATQAAATQAAATQAAATQATGSVHALVAGSRVPTATQDAAFRRATRPQRAFVRAATGRDDVLAFQAGLLQGMDAAAADALSAARPLPPPVAAVSLGTVTGAVNAAVLGMDARQTEPKRVFLTLAAADLAGRLRPDGTLAVPVPGDLQGPQGTLTTALAAWHQAHPHATDAATRVAGLIGAITAVRADGPGAVVEVAAAVFAAEFGNALSGKGYLGVTAVSSAPPPGGKVARMSDTAAALGYKQDVADVAADVAARLARLDPPPPPLGAVATIAAGVVDGLHPQRAVPARVAAALPGLATHLAEQQQTRARRLRPVLAYPTYPDPMVEALQALAREHVLPNIGDLPLDSMTLLEPNGRFIESFLAGLNTEFARELLWREYPTDQRGSCFRVFWDRRDATGASTSAEDVLELTGWVGALGSNAVTGATPLVLVIRSELLHKYPYTLVYAQPAAWDGPPGQGRRTPDLTAAPRLPIFGANLDPDVVLYGFDLDEEQARGHLPAGPDDPVPAAPGWFFVLKERAGQPRFGPQTGAPEQGFRTWDDLWWGQLASSQTYLNLAASGPLAPQDGGVGTWAATSADMAAILFRSPVMYARHADDMLPGGG